MRAHGAVIVCGTDPDEAGMRSPSPIFVTALIAAISVTLLSRAEAESEAASAGPLGQAEIEVAEQVGPGEPNVEFAAMEAGERPPQFIIFSFDGGGSHEKWQTFLAAAEQVDAQFVAFLTGTYLLTDAAKTAYTGPGHAPGKSSVGFGGTPENVVTLIDDLNRAYREGHEIGTHFNGHFCDGNDPSGNDWTTAQWTAELDQFFAFLDDYRGVNRLPDGPELLVPAEAIAGSRTPCLEGEPEVFFPAMAAHGMTYDSSVPVTGLQWPQQVHGLWEFGMPVVPVEFTGRKTIAMDYNFWVQFNGGADEPQRAAEFTAAVLDTYRDMYDDAFAGNRAPIVIGNHFNNWSGNAFNPAIEAFMLEACDRPETVCTTYQNVLSWMQAQDPAVLADLIALEPVGG
ncbi:hypothetical protein BH20ACT5_BH20ACT5_22540 [soil metagenome]